MSIKVVPTKFDGIKFRSRLEARWAVFFKTAKIDYEYEPESFDLDECLYIPDFYLPKFDNGLYCEVKPIGGDFNKAKLFTKKTGKNIWLCEGPPDFIAYCICELVENAIKGPELIEFDAIPLYSSAYDEERMFWQPWGGGDVGKRYDEDEDEWGMASERVKQAVLAAKNERFGIYES